MSTDTPPIVEANFLSDLEKLAAELNSTFNLKHTKDVDSLNTPLCRWTDFRLRYIDPKPRQVVLSNKLKSKTDKKKNDILNYFIKSITKGKDLNPYQSGSMYYHDSSGKKRKQRTDLLWANWGIHHLHFTKQKPINGRYFSPRSNWLLYLLVDDNSIALIDIKNHNNSNAFCDSSLLKTIDDSWSQVLDSLSLNPSIPRHSDTIFDDLQTKELWESGILAMPTVNGKTIIPHGGGITMASTPLIANDHRSIIRERAKMLETAIMKAPTTFLGSLSKALPSKIQLRLELCEHGLCIANDFCNETQYLGRDNPNDGAAILNDSFTPQWAINNFFKKHF
ncbi:MAG: hypothetical protein OCD01_19525 [Fibrobacterales bacterium]